MSVQACMCVSVVLGKQLHTALTHAQWEQSPTSTCDKGEVDMTNKQNEKPTHTINQEQSYWHRWKITTE